MASLVERVLPQIIGLAKDIESHCDCDPIPEEQFIEYDERIRELAGAVPMVAVNGCMRAADLLYHATLWPHLDSTRYAYIEGAVAVLRSVAEVLVNLPSAN